MNNDNEYILKLKKLMQEKKLNQSNLAEKTMISQGLISKYLNEEAKVLPGEENLRAILNILDYPFDKFLFETQLTDNFPKSQRSINICMNRYCPGRQNIDKNENSKIIKGISFPVRAPSGHENNFCDYCGHSLISKCWCCYKPIERGTSKFCSHCGSLLYLACREEGCGQALIIENHMVEVPSLVLNENEIKIFDNCKHKKKEEYTKAEKEVINKYSNSKMENSSNFTPFEQLSQFIKDNYADQYTMSINEFGLSLKEVYFSKSYSNRSQNKGAIDSGKIKIKIISIKIPQINFIGFPFRAGCPKCQNDGHYINLDYGIADGNQDYFDDFDGNLDY